MLGIYIIYYVHKTLHAPQSIPIPIYYYMLLVLIVGRTNEVAL